MRRHIAPFPVIALTAAASLVLAACGPSDGEDDEELETWRLGVLPCAADCGFLRMAEEQDFYAKYGVDVEFVELKSTGQIYPALASGEVDAVEQNPGGLFMGAEQGRMDATVIGSSMQGLPFAIYGSADITDLSELEGRSVAISSPTGLPALVAERMFESAGVNWNSVQQVNAGGNEDRFRAVAAGTADAASSPADYVPRAEEEGINVLALASELVPDYPRLMIIANNESLQEKPEAAAGFLAGQIEGTRYAYENPDEAKQIAADSLGTTPGDRSVTHMHDLIVENELADPDCAIPIEKLEYQEEVLINSGQLQGTEDLNSLVDESYHTKALEMLEDAS